MMFFSPIKRDFKELFVAQFGAPIRGGMPVLWGKKSWELWIMLKYVETN